jgi:hypothetical protein
VVLLHFFFNCIELDINLVFMHALLEDEYCSDLMWKLAYECGRLCKDGYLDVFSVFNMIRILRNRNGAVLFLTLMLSFEGSEAI